MDDRKEAIRLCRRVVVATPVDNPAFAARLNSLGNKLSHTGMIEDLEEAIQLFHQAVELTPPDHADLVQRLYNLGSKFSWRCDGTGRMKGPEKAHQDIRFVADLNDFGALLDRIDSVLTVTGSPQDAFADTAACYVRWHWGQRDLDILNWLSQFLLSAQNSEPSLRTSRFLFWEDKDTEPTLIELQGQLIKQSSTPLSESDVMIRVKRINGGMKNYYIQAAALASQLAWIVAAFKDPPQERVSFSSAKIEGPLPHFHNDEDSSSIFRIKHDEVSLDLDPKQYVGTCWHKLFTGFNVAVGFCIPERPNEMHGVELPFSIMATFAGCSYPVAYEGGFVFKGWQNALFPVCTDSGKGASIPASALQWHLFTSERHRLYMAEAKKLAPKLLPIVTELSPEEFCKAIEQTKRHFLGMYEKSRFTVGTNDSRAGMIAPIRPNDRLTETRLRWLIEWTRVIGLSFGGGLHGVSVGASTGFRIRKLKERQLCLNLQCTKDKVIEAAKTNSTILFNVGTRISWMLPQICIVVHLTQAWTKRVYPNTQVIYPDFNDMSQKGLTSALHQFLNQEVAGDVNLKETFYWFANVLNLLQDEEQLEPAARGYSKRLAGVDFAELENQPKTYSILTTDINVKSGGDWLRVLKCNWNDLKTSNSTCRVLTLFCDSLIPPPMIPIGNVCDTWFPPPIGQDYLVAAMYCIKELGRLYRTDSVMLSGKHYWKRGFLSPFDGCHGRSCNRLQRIATTGCRDEVITDMVWNASPHAAVVFGGYFPADPQR